MAEVTSIEDAKNKKLKDQIKPTKEDIKRQAAEIEQEENQKARRKALMAGIDAIARLEQEKKEISDEINDHVKELVDIHGYERAALKAAIKDIREGASQRFLFRQEVDLIHEDYEQAESETKKRVMN